MLVSPIVCLRCIMCSGEEDGWGGEAGRGRTRVPRFWLDCCHPAAGQTADPAEESERFDLVNSGPPVLASQAVPCCIAGLELLSQFLPSSCPSLVLRCNSGVQHSASCNLLCPGDPAPPPDQATKWNNSFHSGSRSTNDLINEMKGLYRVERCS